MAKLIDMKEDVKAKKPTGCLVLLIVGMVLLITPILLLVFNVQGLQDRFMQFVKTGEFTMAVPEQDPQEATNQEEKRLETERARLLVMEREIAALNAALDERAEQLDLREEELRLREEEVEVLQVHLSKAVEDLKGVITLYEKMESEDAARILSEFEDIEQVTLILKGMKVDKSAEILGLMDAKRAAAILTDMMN